MLETLKEWIVEKGAMPELEELEIRGCEKLEKSQGLERLSHLKELTLTNMKREFVEHVKQNLASVGGSHILLTNKFKSSTTLSFIIRRVTRLSDNFLEISFVSQPSCFPIRFPS
ncbi:unnamed protein product [Camellia sinensis]